MSVGLHAAVLLAGGLLIVVEQPHQTITHGDRRVEIVLAPQNRASKPSYLHEGVAESTLSDSATGSTTEANSNTSSPSAGGGDGDPLPTSGTPVVMAAFRLPDVGASVPSGNVVATPGALGGRGRPSLLPGADEAAILAADAALLRESIPTGPTARMSFFGSTATGRSFVFVIDRSDSMGGSGLGAIEAAAEELVGSIEALSDEQFVQVVAYNQVTTTLTQRALLPATRENKDALLGYVSNLSAYGQTEHTYGLLAALKFRPEVIYLLTDGGDPVPNSLQLRTIREQTGTRTQIHCVHFGEGAESSGDFLRRIAGENRGSYTYIDMRSRR